MFTRENAVGESDLFSIKADGSGEKQLTKTKMNEELGAWSPDGKTIAFSTFTVADGGAIWLMNADGRNPHRIYQERTAFVGLSDWAPDGRSLLIVIDRGGGGQLDLYLIGVNGKGTTQLTTASGDDSGGRWPPDGDRIVFWSDGNPQGAGIYLMNPDGSDQRRIFEDAMNANTVASAWSPSGDQIAWTAKFEGGAGSPIFLMAADGSGLQQVRGGLRRATTLDWGA
jgi:TolB protein